MNFPAISSFLGDLWIVRMAIGSAPDPRQPAYSLDLSTEDYKAFHALKSDQCVSAGQY